MTKVTNKHDAPLNVAGVDVRPGATVEVDAGVFEKWKLGGGAKQWLKAGLIVEGGSAQAETKVKDDDHKDDGDDREALFAEARSLGLNPNANTSTAKLKKMVADKKAE